MSAATAFGALALLLLSSAVPAPATAQTPAHSGAEAQTRSAAAMAPAKVQAGSTAAKAPAKARARSTAAKTQAKPPAAPATAAKVAPLERPEPAAQATAPGPHFSPWSQFAGLSPGDLLSLEVRVGTVGEAAAGGSPAVFGMIGQPLDPDAFKSYRHAGQKYEPDEALPYQVMASPEELAAVIESLGTMAAVSDGHVSSQGQLSIAMIAHTAEATRGFETVLAETDAREAMGRLLGALSGNFAAVNTLRGLGCRTGVLPVAAPENLDSLVKVGFSGLREDKTSPSELIGTVTVTNISEQPLPSPLTLVILVDGTAKLIGAEGQTCRAEPAGRPFVALEDGGALAPRATIQRNVRFWAPDGSKNLISFKLVGGPGTR